MDFDSVKRVPLYLERLIKQFLPSEQALKRKQYFNKLLSIRIAFPALNENSIKESITQVLTPENSKKFLELFLRLIRLKAITKRTQILYVLLKIQNFTPNIIPFAPVAGLADNSKIRVLVVPEKKVEKHRVMQEELIEDVLKVLRDSAGKYLKIQETSGIYDLEDAVALSPFKEMCQKVAELAVLSEKVRKFIKEEHVSSTCALLVKVMQREMKSYDELVEKIKESTNLTIKKIYLWTFEGIERIKHLATLVDSADELKGSQVISAVYNLRNQGNVAVKELMSGILDEISSDLVNMIYDWVNFGDINDPYHEFFITQDPLINEHELWAKKYSLVHEMVPCFFTQELIQSIMIIGKSINFIKISCGEPWFPQDLELKPKISDLLSIRSWISQKATVTNQILLRLINFKYNLELHFLSLKKYLLLTQGDFHQLLMSKVIGLLGENSNKVFKHSLITHLEYSIKGSNSRFDEPECLNRLDIKILEPSPLDTGWDVFVLDYIFSPPLTTIFSASAMTVYIRTFKFLWQVKRAHYLMNAYSFWRDAIVYQTYYELKQVFHVFQLLKSEITHFINNLMSYLVLEVVEASWNVFHKKLAEATGLDELMNIHECFLKDLVEKAFLDDEAMYKRIMGLVELCVGFSTMQDGLLQAAAEERKRREDYIRIGTFDELKVFDEYLCDVNLLKEQFTDEFRDFRQKLQVTGLIHLKFLAFRLDFNEYYELKALEEYD